MTAPAFSRRLVDDAAGQRWLLDQLAKHGDYGFDTESNGVLLVRLRGSKSMVNVFRSRLAGMSFAFPDGTSCYVPVEHRQGNIPLALLPRIVDALFDTGPEQRKWVHNLKHELEAMRHGAVDMRPGLGYLREAARAGRDLGWRCTQVGCWLGDRPSRVEKKPFSLKTLAPAYLGIEMSSFDDTTGGMDFGQLRPQDGLAYACEDAEAALRLGLEVVTPAVEEQGLADWYETVEMPFVWLLRDIETAGMGFDPETNEMLIDDLQREVSRLEDAWAWETDGISITSPKQLASLYADGIWDARGVPVKNTGPSTAAEYIRWQLDRCPPGSVGHRLAELKTDHASLFKLVGTYGESLRDIAAQYPDGRLHGGFLHTGTRTGRLSSSYPNLQNIPKRTELGKRIRDAFVAPEGRVLLSADYSQIELRVMAHFAGKGRLYDGYRLGTDVHAETAELASCIIGIPFTRDQGKTGNFAPIYGSGARRLAKTLGVTEEQAKAFLAAHKNIHAEAHDVLDRARDAGRDRGYVRTLGGRRRRVDIQRAQERLDALRAQGHRYQTSTRYQKAWLDLGSEERIARNTPIQGGAADIVKAGMLAAWRSVPGDMVCQVHDDIIYEVDERNLPEATEALQTALEGAGERFGFRVPLVAEPASAARWSGL